MWQCPKCKREFINNNQKHTCGEPVETIDSYIAKQPEKVQPLLNQVRETIRNVLPDAEERISWSMPTFWHKKILYILQPIKIILDYTRVTRL